MNNLEIVKRWMEKTFKFEPFEQVRAKSVNKVAWGRGKHQGSKRGAVHQHNPVWLPGTPRIRPAIYRQRHMGRQ